MFPVLWNRGTYCSQKFTLQETSVLQSNHTHLSGTLSFSVLHWIHPRSEKCKILKATFSASKRNCLKGPERSSTALPHLLTCTIKKTNHCREKGFWHMKSDQARRDNDLLWGSPESKFLADLIRAPMITRNYVQILNCLCCEVKEVWSQFDFSFSKIAYSRFKWILRNGFYPVLVGDSWIQYRY